MMAVALGADHAGFLLKEDLRVWLADRGYPVLDCGTYSMEPVDYPDIARRVAEAMLSGAADRGVLVCGSGVGMSIAANKFPGVRAALCADALTARLSREHNDANVLALGARLIGAHQALEIVEVWLGTVFGGGRHSRRIEKLAALDQAYAPSR
jgi:ribose 5-phosphate isomerase B